MPWVKSVKPSTKTGILLATLRQRRNQIVHVVSQRCRCIGGVHVLDRDNQPESAFNKSCRARGFDGERFQRSAGVGGSNSSSSLSRTLGISARERDHSTSHVGGFNFQIEV